MAGVLDQWAVAGPQVLETLGESVAWRYAGQDEDLPAFNAIVKRDRRGPAPRDGGRSLQVAGTITLRLADAPEAAAGDTVTLAEYAGAASTLIFVVGHQVNDLGNGMVTFEIWREQDRRYSTAQGA